MTVIVQHYVERTPGGERATGYWHINGHRPELTLLSHSKDKEAESWRVRHRDRFSPDPDGNVGC